LPLLKSPLASSQAGEFEGRPDIIDKIVLSYLGSITVFVVINIPRLPNWRFHLVANGLVSAVVVLIAGIHVVTRHPTAAFVRAFYPVVLLMWLYPQSGLLRHAVIAHDLDAVVSRWDLALFRVEWYRVAPTALDVLSLELLHGVYFLYYGSLGLFAMAAFSTQRRLVGVYVFALMTTMFVHMWFLMLFPASGPVSLRRQMIPEGLVFIPVMNLIYGNMDQGGGAFPSLHAAGAVIANLFACRFFPRWKLPIRLFLIGVLVSTVACSFHYPIDTVGGTLTGLLCYRLVPRLHPYAGNA
jgi:membrane-associated phospholipid phosphatase